MSGLGVGVGGVVRALAVTSSTGVMSVAVGDVGPSDAQATLAVLASADIATERRHAEEITPLIERLLGETDTPPRRLGRLVADIGPGRFTGLRVGLSTIRALAFGLDLPVVALTSLEILGRAEGAGEVTAVIDARRGEVFQQSFVRGRSVGPPVVGDPAELVASAVGVVVGDGADRYARIYRGSEPADGMAPVSPSPNPDRHLPGRNPSAEAMLELSAQAEARPGTEIEPLYLRDPDAVPNIRTRTRPSVGAES